MFRVCSQAIGKPGYVEEFCGNYNECLVFYNQYAIKGRIVYIQFCIGQICTLYRYMERIIA